MRAPTALSSDNTDAREDLSDVEVAGTNIGVEGRDWFIGELSVISHSG